MGARIDDPRTSRYKEYISMGRMSVTCQLRDHQLRDRTLRDRQLRDRQFRDSQFGDLFCGVCAPPNYYGCSQSVSNLAWGAELTWVFVDFRTNNFCLLSRILSWKNTEKRTQTKTLRDRVINAVDLQRWPGLINTLQLGPIRQHMWNSWWNFNIWSGN